MLAIIADTIITAAASDLVSSSTEVAVTVAGEGSVAGAV
jgi:hypothetical protein